MLSIWPLSPAPSKVTVTWVMPAARGRRRGDPCCRGAALRSGRRARHGAEDLRHVDGRGRHRRREGGFSQGHRVSPVRGRDRSGPGDLSPRTKLQIPPALLCLSGVTPRPAAPGRRRRARAGRRAPVQKIGAVAQPSRQIGLTPGRCAARLRAQLARLGHDAARFGCARHRVAPSDGVVAGGPGQNKARSRSRIARSWGGASGAIPRHGRSRPAWPRPASRTGEDQRSGAARHEIGRSAARQGQGEG